MKRVLILRSDIGGGHKSIAKATEQVIKNHLPSVEIKNVNIMPKVGSALQRIAGNYFADSHTKKYKATDNEQSAKASHRLTTPLLFPRISRHILSFKPDLIIGTNAFSTEEVGVTLKILDKTIPHIIILADPFSAHHSWTSYKSADKYLVHDLKTKKIFIRRGIPQNKIAVTGLPLKQEITTLNNNSLKIKQQLGLSPDKSIIFIGGSGEGIGNIYQLVSKLLKSPTILTRSQLIIATGKNKHLLGRFKRLKVKFPNLIFPYGYTNQIHQLISASNFVVSKPGPNLILETLTLGKPFISTGVPMGQEENNNKYIKQHQVGFITIKQPQTIKLIEKLVNSPQITASLEPSIKKWQQNQKNTPNKVWKAIQPFLAS